MTVAAFPPYTYYWGDGVTTAFAYPFEVERPEDFWAFQDDVLVTNYSLSGLGNETGGMATFTTPPAPGASLLLLRRLPLDQETLYPAFSPFPAAAHERTMDRLCMQVQQLQEQLGRASLFKQTIRPPWRDLELPDPHPNTVLGWDSAGQQWTLYPSSVQQIPVDPVSGMGWGKTTVELTPAAGASQASALVFPAGVLALALSTWVETDLGTSQGLQQVGIGTAAQPDCWGLLPDLTAASATSAGLFQGYGGQPQPAGGLVTLTAYGGPFDGTGTVYVTGHFVTFQASHTLGTSYHPGSPDDSLPPPSFLGLTDTPDSYSGQASKLVGVNAAATGVAFAPLVVDASGNLGVGTATPTQRLHVQDGPALVSASTGGMVIIDGPATAFRVLKMSSSGVDRWILRAQNDPETGGNVGSNLAFRRYADDGTFLAAGNILWLERGSGNIGLLGQITFGTGAQNVLGLRTVATAPTTSPADAVQLWGGDRGGVAGKGSLYLRTEDSTSHVLGDLVGLGTLCAASLGSGASYQALTVKGSTLYVGQSSVQERALGGVSTSWVVSTDATRTARLTVSAYDATAAREGLRVEADGSASRLSFHGVAAVVRQTVPAAATDATTTQALVNAVRTALVNYGLCV